MTNTNRGLDTVRLQADGLEGGTRTGRTALGHRLGAWVRVGMGLLAFESLLIGVHALFFPGYFYSSFLLGRGWVQMLPPYNEHITRDLGALYLGFGITLAYAALRLNRHLCQAANLGFAAATLPHMVFHALHTHDAPMLLDKVLQVGLLAFTLALCGGIWWVGQRYFDAVEAQSAGTHSHA